MSDLSSREVAEFLGIPHYTVIRLFVRGVFPNAYRVGQWNYYPLADVEAYKNRPERTIEDKFWERVTPKSKDECWLWEGAVYNCGYGIIAWEGKRYMAHRLSYEIHYGKLKEGMMACHHCDVRNCVNPYHLFEGTGKDNMQDALKKGRLDHVIEACRNRVNPARKLTPSDVLEIREARSKGVSAIALGKAYGVDRNTIYLALKGVHYKEVKDV